MTDEPEVAETHVYPDGDLIHHDVDTDCVCGPEFEFPPGGGMVVVHQSLDRREEDEPGGP